MKITFKNGWKEIGKDYTCFILFAFDYAQWDAYRKYKCTNITITLFNFGIIIKGKQSDRLGFYE